MEYPHIFPWTTDDSLFTFLLPFFVEQNIRFRGVLHIGAHECEERKDYNDVGIPDEKIIWIEGNKELCEKNKQKGIPNIYHALIADCEKNVSFHITNNFQSSSIYPLHTHKLHYPGIQEVSTVEERTMSLPTFFKKHDLNPSAYNLWSLDIQGAEYDALKGAESLLEHVDCILTEINFEKMYDGIQLADTLIPYLKSKGFTMTHLKLWKNSWGDALFVKEKFLKT
jgi:FkbM family methyltransferase